MQNDKTCSDIINNIRTTQELTRTKREIGLLKVGLFKVGAGSYAEVLTTQVSASTAGFLQNGSDKEARLSQIEECLKSMRVVRLTVSFAPSREGIATMALWVKANLGEDVVMDITTDPKVIGGALIEFGGKYIDKSLNSALNNYFHQR